MNWILGFEPQPSDNKINYKDRLLLIGSCFSDNIGTKLTAIKFKTSYNPTGILFDPLSIATHLEHYISARQLEADDLFLYNELWHSWLHHSDFSGIIQKEVLEQLNRSTREASEALSGSNWLFITLGTAYSYRLKSQQLAVANCHKAPGDWFVKRLLDIEEITNRLFEALMKVRQVNPSVKIVLTVSPVKHIRDGIVENTRSKARLIEAAHYLAEKLDNSSYFPAYELVTDVLRDYRFYAPDMAHPNEQAVQFVFDMFCKTYFSAETQQLAEEVKYIVSAKNHKPLHEGTEAHRKFLRTFAEKTEAMKQKLPMLDWQMELDHFQLK